MEKLQKILSSFTEELRLDILDHSRLVEIPEGTILIREGQYVKEIPIVIDGLINVYSSYEDKEVLLYYIRTSESCIMSFSAGMAQQQSPVVATAGKMTTALMLPVDKVRWWTRKYPEMNQLFFREYNHRYSELISTINLILFSNLEKRLWDFLKHRSDLTGDKRLKITHQQIADELGTAREVVSRLMKKLENDSKITQHSGVIEVF